MSDISDIIRLKMLVDDLDTRLSDIEDSFQDQGEIGVGGGGGGGTWTGVVWFKGKPLTVDGDGMPDVQADASPINGCFYCVNLRTRETKWMDAPPVTDAEADAWDYYHVADYDPPSDSYSLNNHTQGDIRVALD